MKPLTKTTIPYTEVMAMADEIWINDVYQVAMRPADKWGKEGGWPEKIHLSIK